MGSNIETALAQILNRMDVMINKWNSDGTRVRTLEDDQRHQYPKNFLPRTENPREHYNESHNQNLRPYHNPYRQNDHFTRNVKVEVPSFVGRLDPMEYIDWEVDMDQYFTYNEMSEGRKVRFAQMKLLGQAKRYWQHVQSVILYRRQESISWDVMKQKLREKYVPISYQKYLPIRRPKLPHTRPTPDLPFVPLPTKKNFENISGLGHHDIENNEEKDIEETIGLGHDDEIQSPMIELQCEELKRDDTIQETLEETFQEFISNCLGHPTSQCPFEEMNTVELKIDENEIEEEIYIADPELAEIYEQYETTQIQENIETDLDIHEEEISLIEEKESEEESICILNEQELKEEHTEETLICARNEKELKEEPAEDTLIFTRDDKNLEEVPLDNSLVCGLGDIQEPSRERFILDQTSPKSFSFHDPFSDFLLHDSPNNFFIFFDIQFDESFLDIIFLTLLVCQLNPLNKRSNMDKFLSSLKNGLAKRNFKFS